MQSFSEKILLPDPGHQKVVCQSSPKKNSSKDITSKVYLIDTPFLHSVAFIPIPSRTQKSGGGEGEGTYEEKTPAKSLYYGDLFFSSKYVS